MGCLLHSNTNGFMASVLTVAGFNADGGDDLGVSVGADRGEAEVFEGGPTGSSSLAHRC